MLGFLKKKKTTTEKVTVDDRLQHIAFIMDGNGRWAQKRGMPREFGHSHGAATFKKIGRYCESIGCKYMTVYERPLRQRQQRRRIGCMVYCGYAVPV